MKIKKASFTLPENLHACCPAERRGIRRDHVRLMVVSGTEKEIIHDSFQQISKYLKRGDLLVLNTSRTIPASLKAEVPGTDQKIEIRLARQCEPDEWEVVALPEKLKAGIKLSFGGDLWGTAIDPCSTGLLQRIKFTKTGSDLDAAIYSMGEPIRYEYIKEQWPLDYYQTVFAAHPGSVEMPSAGRAFTWELLMELKNKGIEIGDVQLHTGLSYFPGGSPKENREAFSVPRKTMDAISRVKAAGGRIIAVGTTVVRALETAMSGHTSGWTSLYIRKGDQLKIVDGILTGFHEPEASHLEMLSAFVSEEQLLQAYGEALKEKYLWHEFGDVNLIFRR